MALWIVYKIDNLGTHIRWTRLGRVRAKHQPDALLRAIRKFRVRENSEQHKLAVRPVSAPRRVWS